MQAGTPAAPPGHQPGPPGSGPPPASPEQPRPDSGVPGYQPPQQPQPTRVQPASAEPYDPYGEDRYGYWDEDPAYDAPAYDDPAYDEPEPYREPEPRSRRRSRRDDRDDRGDRYEPEPRRGRRERRGGGGVPLPSASAVGRIIQLVTGLIALAFVLHIVFTVAGANQDNGFVSFTYTVAKTFVFGLGDVFQPGDATLGVVVNYGLAALIYLWGGRLVGRALKG